MKISDVTIGELKAYANVYHSDDDALFTAILAAVKSFIITYTGLPLTRITTIPAVNPIQMGAESITGTSISGYTVTATLPDNTTISSLVQSDGKWSINVPTNETLNNGDDVSITQKSPSGNVSAPNIVKVGYAQSIKPSCVDDYEDLTIAMKVISNEMYDNRSMTVENDKLNFVIKSIMDSHSVNLL